MCHCAPLVLIGSTLAVPLDYTTIAMETSHLLDAVENCVKETVMYLSRCVSNGLNVNFVLRDMGVLLIRQKKVKMRFYENFLLSLDTVGNLKEIIINVSLTQYNVEDFQLNLKGQLNWCLLVCHDLTGHLV